jgi:hypothetical protein
VLIKFPVNDEQPDRSGKSRKYKNFVLIYKKKREKRKRKCLGMGKCTLMAFLGSHLTRL